MFDVVRSSYFRKTTAVALAVLLSLSSVPAVAFAEVSPDAPSAQQGLSAEHETPAGAESAEDRPLEDEVEAVGQDEVSAEESAEESSEAAGDAPLAPSEAGNGQAAALSDAAGIADDASEGESEGAAVLSSEPEDEQVEKPLLGFVYIDEQSPVAGSAQNIVVALSDEEVRLTRAVLRYFTLTGDHEVAASAVDGNAALFELENLEAGEYQITGFTYAIEGCDAEFHEEFSADAYAFEVQGPADSAVEVAALSLDGGGQLEADVETESAIEDALEEGVVARATTPMVASARLAATPRVSSNIVVALDPGHGGSDSGAVANGLKEKDINLSIAKYCQAALQRNGINVFMTRSSDVYVGLSERVQKAVAAKASVFVSIHINSATPAAEGCEVWVPNDSSYNYDTHEAGYDLGKRVVAKLAALGLKNRGVKTKDSANGSKYSDGSIADYYSVINGARKNGIPGIIIEHAFITNSGEAVKMKSAAFLKKLGEADAQGIIEAIAAGTIKGKGGVYYDGKGYRYLKSDGTDVKSQWIKEGSRQYYFGSDGYALKWSQKIGGSWYYFNGSGVMQTGWVTWKDGTKSFFDWDGKALLGWRSFQGRKCYFDPATGISKRWSQKIDGAWYYFDGDSFMHKGLLTWSSDGRKSYYASDGKLQGGWQTVNGERYYFDWSDGKSLRWSQKIDGAWYYFDGDSFMHKGLLTWSSDGRKSYYASDGKLQGGWQTVNGERYYFDWSDGKSLRWSQKIGGAWYYFDGDSVMQTGWITWKDGTKSFFDWDGKALLGWRSFNGVKYYFDQATGISKRWSQKIDGSWYYFDGTSVMQKGWVTWKDGTKSYFQTDSSGRAAALLGWASLNGKKFYFNPANGISARWSQVIDGKEYYFDGEGVRQTGWITWNNDGSRSYFDPRDNGAMVHGTQVIDGVIYEFESDGRIREAIMGAPKTTVALMVRHFQASGRSYPADVYASKGAATLQQFCGFIYDEAVSEGVRPEVLYSQVMHETGYLQFGGDVKAEQCNFGGLGATGNGVRGEVFPDVRTGLRAQAQHLKAYGSTAALNNPCVDSRFQYVKRGCAPYVANLSGTWAADRQYGKKLLAILKDIVLY